MSSYTESSRGDKNIEGMDHVEYRDGVPKSPSLKLEPKAPKLSSLPQKGRLGYMGKYGISSLTGDLSSPLTRNEPSYSSRVSPRDVDTQNMSYDRMNNFDELHDEPSGRVLSSERPRVIIVRWRQTKCYLFYCSFCFLLTLFIFIWNLVKAHNNGWSIPKWRHHVWEEFLEILLSVLIVSEILISISLVGWNEVCNVCELKFDLFVVGMTIITIGFAVLNISSGGASFEINLPFLIVRSILQPARVLYSFWHIRAADSLGQIDDIDMPEDEELRDFNQTNESDLPVY